MFLSTFLVNPRSKYCAWHVTHMFLSMPLCLKTLPTRYLGSDEEGGSDAEDGLPVRQSQGADLQQLLAESEQFYAQAHFRYRSFIEAVDTEPPPVDVAAFEEVRGTPTRVSTCIHMSAHALTLMHSYVLELLVQPLQLDRGCACSTPVYAVTEWGCRLVATHSGL